MDEKRRQNFQRKRLDIGLQEKILKFFLKIGSTKINAAVKLIKYNNVSKNIPLQPHLGAEIETNVVP